MADVIDRVLMLSKVDAFAQLTSEQLSLLALLAAEVDRKAGEVIYVAGDPPNGMYLVVQGRVALERGETLIAEAAAGEDFGTWALFDAQPRVTAARAATDVRLLHIDRQHFEELVEDYPDLAHGLFRSLAHRVRTLAESIEASDERRGDNVRL